MYAVSAVSVSESGVRPVLADAAEVARRALVELEPDGVGVHLGVTAEGDSAATHRFETTLAGYRGWQWAVVVAAPPGADRATVSESALLPGPDALIAPDFIPWEQRVRPGDLGPGDLLAPPAGDPRLVPGYVATGDPVIDEVAREVGLGRVQVLSLDGRLAAAERWYAEYGPDTEMAKAAPATCGLCGFYVPLAGALRDAFGVCANEMGADGHVVHVEYGCGAHSDVTAPSGNGSPRYEAFDDHAVDFVDVARATDQANAAGGQASAIDGDSADQRGTAPVPADQTDQQETAATQAANADQETAEAVAVEAAAADRAALAEGAAPESPEAVVAAEVAASTEQPQATDPAPVADGTSLTEADAAVTIAASDASATAAAGFEAPTEEVAPGSAEAPAEVAPEARFAPAGEIAGGEAIATTGASEVAAARRDIEAADAAGPSAATDTASVAGADPAAADAAESGQVVTDTDARASAGASVADVDPAAAGDAKTGQAVADEAEGAGESQAVADADRAGGAETASAGGASATDADAQRAGEFVDEHGSSVAR